VLAASVAVGAGVALFELTTQLVAPSLPVWQSVAATGGFAATAAACVAFVLSRKTKRTREALEGSRRFYLDLFEDFPSLIWRASGDHEADYFNQAWLDFTGRMPSQEVGDGWIKGIHPDDVDEYRAIRRVSFIRREPYQVEYRLRRRDDVYRWMVEHGRPLEDPEGNYLGFIGVCSDVTAVKEQAETLEQLSTHDPLTGLPNRRSMEHALDRQVSRSARGMSGALLYMDVDNFKTCNDTRGHEFGDVILVGVADVLRKAARTEEMVARLGGDEFALLLERATARTAKFVADRLRAGVREFAARQKVELDLSVGVAMIDGRTTGDRVMREADAAMYVAKQSGKGQTSVSNLGGLHDRLAAALSDRQPSIARSGPQNGDSVPSELKFHRRPAD
jgi:diguanylate cyclase (GGDEF)-like protein/PAS domain S-box-containing protein